MRRAAAPHLDSVSYRARQALSYKTVKKSAPADNVVDQHWPVSDDQLQLCRGESTREGSGRDGIVPLMLQRDYTVSMPTI